MKKLNVLSTGLLLVMISLLNACTPTTEVDVIIRGGTIIDGSGKDAFIGDVAIKDSLVVAVGYLNRKYSARHVIDAKGLMVSPGFIDTHTHSLQELVSNRDSLRANINYLTQGVTTVFNGNDGFGTRRAEKYTFESIKHVIDTLNLIGIGTNTAFLVGHNQIRLEVMCNPDNNSPNKKERKLMKMLVRQGMEEGAYGFSSGLFYYPGHASKKDEVIDLAAEVKPFGGIYDTHIRSESSRLVKSIKEALEIGQKAEVPLHIAHIKSSGPKAWKETTRVIELIDSARKTGQLVTADQYPWEAAGSTLWSLFVPQTMQKNLKDTIKDNAAAAKIEEHVKGRINLQGDSTFLFLTNRNGPDSLFKTSISFKKLNEVAKVENLTSVEVIMKLLKEGKYDENMASFSMRREHIKKYMSQGKWNMFCSDGTEGHPRKFGTFPKIYQDYVRKDKLMSIEEFVRRATSLPAQTFMVSKRGELKPDFYADIIVWSRADFKANADFEFPEKLSTGMKHVFVNGKQMLKDSVWTFRLSGKALQKSSRTNR